MKSAVIIIDVQWWYFDAEPWSPASMRLRRAPHDAVHPMPRNEVSHARPVGRGRCLESGRRSQEQAVPCVKS